LSAKISRQHSAPIIRVMIAVNQPWPMRRGGYPVPLAI